MQSNRSKEFAYFKGLYSETSSVCISLYFDFCAHFKIFLLNDFNFLRIIFLATLSIYIFYMHLALINFTLTTAQSSKKETEYIIYFHLQTVTRKKNQK